MTYLYPYRRGTGWRSQGFRSNRNKGANGPGGHTGFDQAMAAGQPLYAPGDGIIRNSGWLTDNYKDNGWWLTRMGGDTLVIDMVDSFRRSSSLPTFIFAHCSDTMAEVGQFVRKGQLIARSGNTGTATTGAHVHIEALPPSWDFNNGVYGRVDPEIYFDEWVDDYVGGLAAQGTTTTASEEDDMFTDEDRALLRATLNKADGGQIRADLGYQNDTLFTKADGAWQNGILADISARLGHTLSKEDGGYIVGLLEALKPGNTNAEAIAAAVVDAVGEELAADVVAAIGLKLVGAK